MEYLNEPPLTAEEKANLKLLKITDGILTGVTDHRKLLGTLVLPDGITEISMFTFVACSGLKSIIIPDSVTKIGTGTFTGCSGLTNIVIPASVTEIGDRAFSGVNTDTYFTVTSESIRELLLNGDSNIRDEQITVYVNL